MNVAFGLKAHSGWAALVVLGKQDEDLIVVDRQRIELVDERWAKQPYHAADGLKPDDARTLVERGFAAAHKIASREMRILIKREDRRHNNLVGCAVLVSDPMPEWTTDQILAVHFRMHKAEGVLFRDALVAAAKSCKLRLDEVNEKQLLKTAQQQLGLTETKISKRIVALGKQVGPPWTKDQKDAALAAMIALHSSST